jgi:hypothetical protein
MRPSTRVLRVMANPHSRWDLPLENGLIFIRTVLAKRSLLIGVRLEA